MIIFIFKMKKMRFVDIKYNMVDIWNQNISLFRLNLCFLFCFFVYYDDFCWKSFRYKLFIKEC